MNTNEEKESNFPFPSHDSGKRIRRPSTVFGGALTGSQLDKEFNKAMSALEKERIATQMEHYSSVKVEGGFGFGNPWPCQDPSSKKEDNIGSTIPCKVNWKNEPAAMSLSPNSLAINTSPLVYEAHNAQPLQQPEINHNMIQKNFNALGSKFMANSVNKPGISMKKARVDDSSLNISKTASGGGICNLCGNTYTVFSKCKMHYIKSHGETGAKIYACLLCKEGFAYQQNLNDHLRKNHKIFSALTEVNEGLAKTASGGGVCLVCGSQYTVFAKCKRHFKDKHRNYDPLQHIGRAQQNIDDQVDTSAVMNQYHAGNQNPFIQTPQFNMNMLSSSDLNEQIKEENAFFTGGFPTKDYKMQFTQQNIDSQTDSSQHLNEGHQGEVESKQHFEPLLSDMGIASSEKHANETVVASRSTTPICDITDMKISPTESGGGLCEICGKLYAKLVTCKSHYIKVHSETGLTDIIKQEEVNKSQMLSSENNSRKIKVPKSDATTMLIKPVDINLLRENDGEAPPAKILKEETGYSNDTMLIKPVDINLLRKNDDEEPPAKIPKKERGYSNDYSSNGEGTFTDSQPEIRIAAVGQGAICLVCNKSFTMYGNCKVHYIKMHGEDGNGKNVCLICEKKFNFVQNLRDHLKCQHKVNGMLKRSEKQGDNYMMAEIEGGPGGVCLKCKTVFTMFGNLKVHYLKKHLN